MAKYFVLEASQDPQSRAHRHVKKSAAEALLRKNLARRIAHNIIQMVAVREVIANLGSLSTQHKVVEIPELLPPRSPDWLFTNYPIRDDRTVRL